MNQKGLFRRIDLIKPDTSNQKRKSDQAFRRKDKKWF